MCKTRYQESLENDQRDRANAIAGRRANAEQERARAEERTAAAQERIAAALEELVARGDEIPEALAPADRNTEEVP